MARGDKGEGPYQIMLLILQEISGFFQRFISPVIKKESKGGDQDGGERGEEEK